MNLRYAAFLIGAAVIVAGGMAHIKTVREEEERKRREIALESREQIRAMWKSAIEMQKRIQRGKYRRIEDVMRDFDFFTIANRNENLNNTIE